ncbi:MAG: ISKra4 family transposase [Cyanobacteria bacterium J06621_11]
MDYEFRVVVEKVPVAGKKVVKRETIATYEIQPPQTILELGLRHEQQISLLSKVQETLLAEQSPLIDTGDDTCPQCGQKLSKNGFMKSKFHAVFSDHQLRLQKHRCKNADCGWQRTPTSTTVFGTDIHPDLAKLQCEQGALHSYREAESNLEKLNVHHRPVNNHVRVQTIIHQVGEQLSQKNQHPPMAEDLSHPADALIIQVDGGHIPTKDKDKRSFEALSGVIYQPNNLEVVDNHHRRISDKSCVISALDDDLKTFKTYVHNAALRQGLNAQTQVTGLADGASNCWSAILALRPHCQSLELILDWFHIGKKFKTVTNALGEVFEESLEKAKWTLWHGDAKSALRKLALLRDNLTDEKKRFRLKGLHDYLKNNQDYLVNYDAREKAGKPFTSQVAESHIDTLINARHKRKQKMQWTRKGAHHVLQIRALMASNEWEEKWLDLVLPALVTVA